MSKKKQQTEEEQNEEATIESEGESTEAKSIPENLPKLQSGESYTGVFSGFNEDGNGVIDGYILPTKLIPRFQTIDVGSEVTLTKTSDGEFNVVVIEKEAE